MFRQVAIGRLQHAAEAELAVVRQRERMFDAVGLDQRSDRAESLLRKGRHALLYAGEDRRLKKDPGPSTR